MRMLTIDPGEDTGYAVFDGGSLILGATEKMWAFIDRLWEGDDEFDGIELVVCEDWALYPWKLKSLGWDKCRTARAIGAIELICRIKGIRFVLQPAKIKEAAQAGGAQELFYKPLHENRHANDAIMHGWHFLQMEIAREMKKNAKRD